MDAKIKHNRGRFKMKSKEKIAFGILFLFALFGVLILGNIIHENSHRWD